MDDRFEVSEEFQNFLEEKRKYKPNEEMVLYRCKKCGGSLLRRLSNGYEIAEDCQCMKQERVEKKIQKFQKLSIIDRNAGNDCFENAKYDTEEEKDLYLKSQKYVELFATAIKNNCGLLFTGEAGNGKTFLANCISNALKKKGYSVLSFSLAGYLRIIRDSISTKENIESQLLSAIQEADLLFIDDLGSEKLTEEWGKEKAFTLIDERYRAGKPILITTNLTPKQLENHLNFNNSNKIVDRLFGMTKIIPFTWASKRRQKQGNLWEEL